MRLPLIWMCLALRIGYCAGRQLLVSLAAAASGSNPAASIGFGEDGPVRYCPTHIVGHRELFPLVCMHVAIHSFTRSTKTPHFPLLKHVNFSLLKPVSPPRRSHVPDAITHSQDVANHRRRPGSPGASQSSREWSINNHPVTLARLCFHHPRSVQLVPQHRSLSAHPSTGELPSHHNPPLELPLLPIHSQRPENPDSHPAHRGTRTAAASGHYPHHPRFLAAAT